MGSSSVFSNLFFTFSTGVAEEKVKWINWLKRNSLEVQQVTELTDQLYFGTGKSMSVFFSAVEGMKQCNESKIIERRKQTLGWNRARINFQCCLFVPVEQKKTQPSNWNGNNSFLFRRSHPGQLFENREQRRKGKEEEKRKAASETEQTVVAVFSVTPFLFWFASVPKFVVLPKSWLELTWHRCVTPRTHHGDQHDFNQA